MANNVRGVFSMPLHMSPVGSSHPKVSAVDRRFLDDLERASGVQDGRDTEAAAGAASAQAATTETASATASSLRRALLGRSSGVKSEGDGRTPVAAEAASATTSGRSASSTETAQARGRFAPHVVPPTPTGPAETDPDGTIISRGTLSDDPHTAGMYVPPDFYHGSSYSPVFDHQDEDGNWVETPRFEGQKIYSKWRGSLPPDFDPNARVIHDPLLSKQGPNWWKQDENGDWVRRPEGTGGLALKDDGTLIFSLDPAKYPGQS